MSTLPIPDQQLYLLKRSESCEDSDEGFRFAGNLVVYRAKGSLFHAMLKGRLSSSNFDPESLINVKEIPTWGYRPRFSIEFMLALKTLPNDCFIKKPSLISYGRISEGPRQNLIAKDFLKEVKICELLIQRPHPNIAVYLGCQVSDGTITGLYLKYSRTLMKEVNPGALMKRALRDTREAMSDYSHILTGIESGIRHLRPSGLVHNDINPSNMMIENDRAIIIDFRSCRKLGESLEDVGRTYEWYMEKLQQSFLENDFNALEEILIWLGVSSKEFQFDI
ncbi:hypothetical protein N7495_009616 [Penicillium taxi]|uniref:uncharacterized protein n=1 Tax=Penicillium taxi TaxID=168475 RepID=UPI00254535E2|nr:uncharacterized protein N7495_009616 [Penicillium taxi]KAJ5885106.1 hypothetical protein N7495_009616 [Penicillium taxi]